MQLLIKNVAFADRRLCVTLDNDRTIKVPLYCFPRLRDATELQLQDHRLIGGGLGIHWPLLDEDISVHGLLLKYVDEVGL